MTASSARPVNGESLILEAVKVAVGHQVEADAVDAADCLWGLKQRPGIESRSGAARLSTYDDVCWLV